MCHAKRVSRTLQNHKSQLVTAGRELAVARHCQTDSQMRHTLEPLSSFSISKWRYQPWSRYLSIMIWNCTVETYKINPVIHSYAQALWGSYVGVLPSDVWPGNHSSYHEQNIMLDSILVSPGNVLPCLGPDSGFLLKFLSKPVYNSGLY